MATRSGNNTPAEPHIDSDALGPYSKRAYRVTLVDTNGNPYNAGGGSSAVTANQGTAGASPWPVSVSNFPASQNVSVSNFPATQPVSGTVAATQSGAWSVSITGSVAVTGTFYQATQPVSVVDGGSVTQGAKSDTAATGTTITTAPFSIIALLKGIYNACVGATPAGTNTIGAVNVNNSSTFVDRSGTTSATAGTFTTPFAANASRQFYRITNLAASGYLMVYDKTSGTPSSTNCYRIQSGGSATFDARVPSGAIQVAGSAASMAFEAAEG